MKRYLFFITAIFFIALSFFSCTRTKVKQVDLSQIEEIRADNKWGVITSPYATYFEKPDDENETSMHGRKGDIIKILGKQIQIDGKNRIVWYKFENGWIQENDIAICTNHLQAKITAEKIMKE